MTRVLVIGKVILRRRSGRLTRRLPEGGRSSVPESQRGRFEVVPYRVNPQRVELC